MIPTLLLGRDCCRGRRHRRHRHDIVGPRRRRQGHLERRERVALDAEEEASVAAERVDEGRLGVRRRDLGRGHVEKVEAAAADESTPEPIVLVLGTADNIAHALDADPDAFRDVNLRVEFTR